MPFVRAFPRPPPTRLFRCCTARGDWIIDRSTTKFGVSCHVVRRNSSIIVPEDAEEGGHVQEIAVSAFSPDGCILASAALDG